MTMPNKEQAIKARIQTWIANVEKTYEYWCEQDEQAPSLKATQKVHYYAGQLIAYKDVLGILE